MGEEGLTEDTLVTDTHPDKGFMTNPLDEEWKPDLSGYEPELRARLEKLLGSSTGG